MALLKTVLQRLLKLLGVVLIVSFLTFCLTKLLPGDPVNTILGPQASDPSSVAALRQELGLDKPFFEQYGSYVHGVVTELDLGRAYSNGFEVRELLANRLPATIELILLTQVLALLISVPLALYSSYRSNSRADRAITAGAFGLISVPSFAMAVLLVYVFAIQLGWFPAVGYDRLSGPEGVGANLRSLALPVMVLVAGLTAVYTRVLRSDLIATLQEDFILMARSKGLPTWHLLLHHALRPSSFSLLTVFGINFGTLIGGSVIVEYYFSIPGIGRLAIDSIARRDYLAVQGVVLVVAIAFVVVNFLVDLLYAVLDPRVRRAPAR
ncbi:MAG: ABC transporter permease [Acidimicrobiales bacterium]|nr:ABC transporter permease [Acidimicrobiales bacterium]